MFYAPYHDVSCRVASQIVPLHGTRSTRKIGRRHFFDGGTLHSRGDGQKLDGDIGDLRLPMPNEICHQNVRDIFNYRMSHTYQPLETNYMRSL